MCPQKVLCRGASGYRDKVARSLGYAKEPSNIPLARRGRQEKEQNRDRKGETEAIT